MRGECLCGSRILMSDEIYGILVFSLLTTLAVIIMDADVPKDDD